ncbi:MAG: SLBB domain-containing protein [Steroidobacteraceae bacterium]
MMLLCAMGGRVQATDLAASAAATAALAAAAPASEAPVAAATPVAPAGTDNSPAAAMSASTPAASTPAPPPAAATSPAAAPLAGTAAASAAPAVPNADYHLGPGDMVRISVFGYADLGIDTRISESGNLGYPFIGQIPVGGMSVSQAEQLIARKLVEAAIVKQPQVSMLVLQYESQKISVMGQVAKPGQYPLEKASRLLDVLAEAGGALNETAADEATLLQKDGKKLTIDLRALFDGDLSQNPSVGGGDTLFVPRAAQFYIQGEVQRAGVYRLQRNMSVSQAIAAGGGLTRRGSTSRIEVQRRDDKGRVVSSSVKNSDLVRADDVLVVKESLF